MNNHGLMLLRFVTPLALTENLFGACSTGNELFSEVITRLISPPLHDHTSTKLYHRS